LTFGAGHEGRLEAPVAGVQRSTPLCVS
jgi:hypothetical protein